MIFESPDKGKTVYVRPAVPDKHELNNLWFQWRDILTASKNNPALREALDRAYIIYELSRRDKD